MAESFKDKIQDAGQKIAEGATHLGNKISEKAEEVGDWAKEKSHAAGNRLDEAGQKVGHATGAPLSQSTGSTGSVADIKEHMAVYGSCGKMLGKVDHVLGDKIKLTKNDSPDGMHHLIPTSWVAKVHDHVHLNKDCDAAMSEWTTA